jgi:hypothetical protein
MLSSFLYKALKTEKSPFTEIVYGAQNRTEEALRQLSIRSSPVPVVHSFTNSIRSSLSKMDLDEPDEEILDSIYSFVARDDAHPSITVLNSDGFSKLLTWFSSTRPVQQRIAFIFVELARHAPTFCQFVSMHSDFLCDQLQTPELCAPLFTVFAISIEFYPSICRDLHQRRILNLMKLFVFHEEDINESNLVAVSCLLVSLCRVESLILESEFISNDIAIACDLCHVLLSFKVELLEEAGFFVMHELVIHGVRFDLLFDFDTMELISRLATKERCMTHIAEVVCEICRLFPNFADQLLEETALLPAFARFIRCTHQHLVSSMNLLIAVAKLSRKWSEIILEYEFIQTLALPTFHNSSHQQKAAILMLFTIVGSQCPDLINECSFLGEVIDECIDYVQCESMTSDFILSFVTMLSRVIEIRECPHSLDRALLLNCLEELHSASPNETIRTISHSILTTLTCS